MTKYKVNIISAFGDTKSGYSDSIPLDAFHEFITGPHDETQETLISIDRTACRSASQRQPAL
jgi:hypothetical protein